MTPVPLPIDAGTSVGPYVVERQLAQGGMSVLYVARDPEGTRLVLKMVLPDVATTATRARLLREARALALVDHPGVVRVHGTGEHGGMPWIAMDLVQGTDLKRVIAERGPLPVDAALRYAIQAAQALVAAHDAGVVHRDLKPSNVLLTPDGRIVLVDFGIAKRRADARDGDVLTSAREVLGTPAYLSPEQLDHGLADERSDIWALGCMLFEMLTGAPPFGRGGSATTAAILRDEPAFPPHVPADVAHVISACLRKNSFARIASPRELLALLRDSLEHPRSDEAPAPEGYASSTRPASSRSSTRSSSTPPNPDTRPSSRPPVRSQSPFPSARASARRPSSMPPTSPSGILRASTARGRIKGTAIRAAIAWFAEEYGEPALERAVERSLPGVRALFRERDPVLGVMASGWYDTQLIGEFLDIIESVAAPSDSLEWNARLGAAIARDNVAGVYRSLFRLIASPPLLEANAQRVWQTYSDEGTLTVRIIRPGSFEATVRGWTHHHATVCRVVAPLMEQVLRTLGYGTPSVERRRCVAQGSTQCAFEGHWH